MEQYISKSALVAEMNKLKNISLEYGYTTEQRVIVDVGKDLILRRLFDYIDTLEVKNIQEEPVSEELETEINYLSKRYPEVSFAKLSRIAVRVAKWQKKQDKETIELAEDHAMLAGIIKGTEHTIGNVRSILNKIAYRNNGLDVNGDYCEQRYVELDEEFKKLLKED